MLLGYFFDVLIPSQKCHFEFIMLWGNSGHRASFIYIFKFASSCWIPGSCDWLTWPSVDISTCFQYHLQLLMEAPTCGNCKSPKMPLNLADSWNFHAVAHVQSKQMAEARLSSVVYIWKPWNINSPAIYWLQVINWICLRLRMSTTQNKNLNISHTSWNNISNCALPSLNDYLLY